MSHETQNPYVKNIQVTRMHQQFLFFSFLTPNIVKSNVWSNLGTQICTDTLLRMINQQTNPRLGCMCAPNSSHRHSWVVNWSSSTLTPNVNVTALTRDLGRKTRLVQISLWSWYSIRRRRASLHIIDSFFFSGEWVCASMWLSSCDFECVRFVRVDPILMGCV